MICDDEHSVVSYITNEVRAEKPDAEITCVYSISELIELSKKEQRDFDVIFLDIMVEEQNSVKSGEAIASYFPRAKIIYITGFYDRASEVLLKLRPFGFINKPLKRADILAYLKKYEEETTEDTFCFSSKREIKMIKCNDIAFIESKRNCLLINTANSVYTDYEKISSVESRLSKCFCRCHQSYIVNLKHVKSVSDHCFELLDGRRVGISRAREKDALNQYYKFKSNIL